MSALEPTLDSCTQSPWTLMISLQPVLPYSSWPPFRVSLSLGLPPIISGLALFLEKFFPNLFIWQLGQNGLDILLIYSYAFCVSLERMWYGLAPHSLSMEGAPQAFLVLSSCCLHQTPSSLLLGCLSFLVRKMDVGHCVSLCTHHRRPRRKELGAGSLFER